MTVRPQLVTFNMSPATRYTSSIISLRLYVNPGEARRQGRLDCKRYIPSSSLSKTTPPRLAMSWFTRQRTLFFSHRRVWGERSTMSRLYRAIIELGKRLVVSVKGGGQFLG